MDLASGDRPAEPIIPKASGALPAASSRALPSSRRPSRAAPCASSVRPYVFGGTSTSGFDCSGFVQHVFAMLGIGLPRTADAQYDAGKPAVGGPRAGDLVFFDTYGGVSHVGIYLGHGNFVHASSSHGVMVSNLSDSYWASRYVGAKRIATH